MAQLFKTVWVICAFCHQIMWGLADSFQSAVSVSAVRLAKINITNQLSEMTTSSTLPQDQLPQQHYQVPVQVWGVLSNLFHPSPWPSRQLGDLQAVGCWMLMQHTGERIATPPPGEDQRGADKHQHWDQLSFSLKKRRTTLWQTASTEGWSWPHLWENLHHLYLCYIELDL